MIIDIILPKANYAALKVTESEGLSKETKLDSFTRNTFHVMSNTESMRFYYVIVTCIENMTIHLYYL